MRSLVVVPRVRDLGNGFAVRRAMPNDNRQLVGPFIFFDQMGPVQFLAGQAWMLGAFQAQLTRFSHR